MSIRSNLYWSVRREVWEHRSIYFGPLAVAALALFGFLITTIDLAERMRALSMLDPARQRHLATMPYSIAASLILISGWIVGIFFCVDALNGERRDRSILFWKSMPVSDLTTVVSKAIVPVVVVPLVAIAVVLATQATMLLLSTAVLLANGLSPAIQWTPLPLFHMTLVMFYGVAVHAFWFAPIFGWLFLVSAWARRAPLLWAVLPLFAIYGVERVAFGTTHFVSLLQYRLMGAMTEAFALGAMKAPITELSQLDPVKFLGSPNLWLGLAFAAVCLAAAVRLRRLREPT